jgi:microcompartment protein CcmK/EutM
VDQATNLTYRWSGSAYVEISPSLALGETSSTAYRGDRGKIAYDHSQATHARTDATKTEASATNGNIKINGTETTVYTHPGSGTNPHGTTKSDVGLGNVGNFKAVSTVASQGLSSTEQSNARANIGAGTSSLTLGTSSSTAYRGDYGNTAYTHSQSAHARTDATKTEASSTNGNIKINGTETTVYTHPGSGTNPHGTTKSDVGLGNVGNFKAVSTVSGQGLTDTEKSNARTNIGAGTSSLTIGSTSSTAAAGDHTHTLTIAASTGTSQISLESGAKYQLTAGGKTYIFTTPANTTVDSFEECTSADIDEVFE